MEDETANYYPIHNTSHDLTENIRSWRRMVQHRSDNEEQEQIQNNLRRSLGDNGYADIQSEYRRRAAELDAERQETAVRARRTGGKRRRKTHRNRGKSLRRKSLRRRSRYIM